MPPDPSLLMGTSQSNDHIKEALRRWIAGRNYAEQKGSTQIIDRLLPLQPSTPATEVYSGFPVHGNDTVLTPGPEMRWRKSCARKRSTRSFFLDWGPQAWSWTPSTIYTTSTTSSQTTRLRLPS